MFENLKLNDTGDRVVILQQKLKMLGLYNAVITGIFGLSTEVGVKEFQKQMGLEQTGVVNQETWEKLSSYTDQSSRQSNNYPNLSFSSTGTYVIDLQTKLKALLYYTKDINGNFDLETENAVKRFQLNNDLTANGVVNSTTWNVLNSLYGNLNKCAIENGESDSSIKGETYIVKKGDTLYSIAKRFNLTVDELKNINNLTSNILQIGEVLKVSSISEDSDNNENSNNFLKYTVVKNDTLYSIASRFNTTVNELKIINNLTSNILQIGQELIIPDNNTEKYIDYIVKKGDKIFMGNNKYMRDKIDSF